MDTWFTDEFAHNIFTTKYAGDTTSIGELFLNIAEAASLGDSTLYSKFFKLMYEKKFSPGGRILAYGGRRSARVSLMNCTTHAVEGDSLDDIARASYTIMRASSRGQGIGLDISALRPADSPVNNAAKTSTGAISFMELLNHVGSTIGQEGRRAALLFSIRDDHPDLWRPDNTDVTCPKCYGEGCLYCTDGYLPYDFLHVKKYPGKVESANISVLISDAFMRAVIEDLPWTLSFDGRSGGDGFSVRRDVMARELFSALSNSAYASAEPGLLYWDTSRRLSNSDLFGTTYAITGVNACSEQVLDQDGVCNLGSMNLAAYVRHPFTGESFFDLADFQIDVETAVRFLDNILDVELAHGASISERQRLSIENIRRVGLGVMGLADALAMLGLSYGGERDTIQTVAGIFRTLRDAAYMTSVKLAMEKGKAPVWDESEDYVESIVSKGFFATLPDYLRRLIVKHGTRNVTLLSVAPTGTISNLFGVASGIEPLFAHQFSRRTRMTGVDQIIEYVQPGVRLSRMAGLPDSIWPTAYEVSPEYHVLIQALAQQYVDQAISKTLNFPAGTSPADVGNAYLSGWRQGLKGMAVYVDGSRDEQVLYRTVENKETCPACGGEIVHKDGCKECAVCEWAACSI